MAGKCGSGEKVHRQMVNVRGLHGSQQGLLEGHLPSPEY